MDPVINFHRIAGAWCFSYGFYLSDRFPEWEQCLYAAGEFVKARIGVA